ncbi:retrovirus-related Pol polyprotein from transposon 297 [Trichonephila clavipes]|uniref:Retrovirus-related Pol polyprotein from transposon 297 n=1 Tax=Trichonephila clavipes TaxID=2585209 RepID=A0A8X6SE20_TRICX|nr:retrovirus-related Pol polyprotein from transposon 297 [Trichonephila clavipes]GFY06759.1 retrovirus-related Pol polyprotein from transposon 297 [Trichonephila clavipes]
MEGILEEKERELEERRQSREYELEWLRLSNATETVSVSSTDLEGQGVNRRVNLIDLVLKFDAKNADINLFFEIFERQAKKEKVSDDWWVSQLIPLLPVEFQLTPVALRHRFEFHQRRPGILWSDLVFDLRSYLENWLVGMEIKDLKELKELLVTEQLKERAPIEVVDHFIDSWDNFKDPTELVEKLDHFEAGTSQIRGSEREWERLFERKKPIICYYCNDVGHIKPACPKLMKTDFETVASLRVNSEDEDCFEKFKLKFEINGVERQCLRYTGCSIDLCASSWIDENDYLGEYVLVKSLLDDVCHRLSLAKIKFKTKGGEFYTKAAVKVNRYPSETYLLSNLTAELIQSREKSVLMIDAMLTRNASKIVPFEKERGPGLNAASGFSIENADSVFPTPGDGTEPTIEFPAFVEKIEGETAQLKNSVFSSEQNKCKDLHVLRERTKWYVCECCGTKEGNLESCWDERREGRNSEN